MSLLSTTRRVHPLDAASATDLPTNSGALQMNSRPFHRMVQPPAARTLRTQSVFCPHGRPIRNVVEVGMTAIGVAYSLPLERPSCFSTAHSGRNRCPASRRATLLKYFTAPGGPDMPSASSGLFVLERSEG